MSLSSFVSSRFYKNFMSKVYGWGAALVIMGALFKINHYTGADIMLIIGLTTEALIFFFSAFEPPHVEPDWSLVYPELAGMYHGGAGTPGAAPRKGQTGKTVSQDLDDMLSKAKIGPELIESLGDGMRKMSENVGKMSDITSTAVATDEFTKSVKDASKSAGELSNSYKKTAEVLNQDASTVGEFSNSVKSAATSAGTLATVYTEVSAAIKKEMSATEQFSNTMAMATESANKLAQKYNQSAELLGKSAEALNFSALDSKSYNEQLQKISKNLTALNAIYELQLQSSNEQIESTNKLRTTVNTFLASMSDSSGNMTKYKEEIDQLTKRVSALNQVYGNMLTAMNVNMNK
ncbi:MAG: gliding motility protein GldL [Bacteroidales bacterium]|nr:gliding motility protein GldL [Bacteroidales bacterium]